MVRYYSAFFSFIFFTNWFRKMNNNSRVQTLLDTILENELPSQFRIFVSLQNHIIFLYRNPKTFNNNHVVGCDTCKTVIEQNYNNTNPGRKPTRQSTC